MNSAAQTTRGATQLIVELGPTLAFVLSYNVLQRTALGSDAIYWATGIFMASTALAIAYCWFSTKKVPPVLVVSGVLILGFGALTIGFRDDTFIKIKPTIVNLFYAGAVLGALALGHNVWRLLFQHAFSMPRRIWDVLALRWGLFFLAMAGLNEVLRQIMTQAEWVNARLWLVYPLIGLFMLANLPITLKWIGKTDADYDAAKARGPQAEPAPPAA